MEYANQHGGISIGITGQAGQALKAIASLTLVIASTSVQRIEDVAGVAAHLACLHTRAKHRRPRPDGPHAHDAARHGRSRLHRLRRRRAGPRPRPPHRRHRQPAGRARRGGAARVPAGPGRLRRPRRARRHLQRPADRRRGPPGRRNHGRHLGVRSGDLLPEQHRQRRRAARRDAPARRDAAGVLVDRRHLRRAGHGADDRRAPAAADQRLRRIEADVRADHPLVPPRLRAEIGLVPLLQRRRRHRRPAARPTGTKAT